jgi:hypothetical protein
LAARRLQLVLALAMVATFAAPVARAGSSFPLTSAVRRSPQIPVHGSALQDYFDAVGDSIQVDRDQIVVELLTSGSRSSAGDREFVDTILFLASQGECVICPPFTYPVTPVRRATWSDLKQHFH